MSSATPLIVVVLLAPALLTGIVLLVIRLVRAKPVIEPSCRRCRYAIVGLTGHVCPECGADLHKVGILQPGSRPPSLIMSILIWSLLFALPAELLCRAVSAVAVRTVAYGYIQGSLVQPASGAFARVDMVVPIGAGPGQPMQIEPRTVRLTMRTNDGRDLVLDVDRANRGFKTTDASGAPIRATEPLDSDQLLAWMSDHGIETESDGVDGDASAMMNYTRHLLGTSPLTVSWTGDQSSMSTSATATMRNQWVRPASRLFMLGIWLIGLAVITVRHHRVTPLTTATGTRDSPDDRA